MRWAIARNTHGNRIGLLSPLVQFYFGVHNRRLRCLHVIDAWKPANCKSGCAQTEKTEKIYISSGVNAAMASPQRRLNASAAMPTSHGMEIPPAFPKQARTPNLETSICQHGNGNGKENTHGCTASRKLISCDSHNGGPHGRASHTNKDGSSESHVLG
jgi:hypothetical protein